jgi:hypothetical protein
MKAVICQGMKKLKKSTARKETILLKILFFIIDSLFQQKPK